MWWTINQSMKKGQKIQGIRDRSSQVVFCKLQIAIEDPRQMIVFEKSIRVESCNYYDGSYQNSKTNKVWTTRAN